MRLNLFRPLEARGYGLMDSCGDQPLTSELGLCPCRQCERLKLEGAGLHPAGPECLRLWRGLYCERESLGSLGRDSG